MEKDYSEYRLSTIEKYRMHRRNSKDVQLDYFCNQVQFFPNERRFEIFVDAYNEDIILLDEMREFNALEATLRNIKEDVPEPRDEELEREAFEKNNEVYERFCQRYDIERWWFEEKLQYAYAVRHPDEKVKPQNNVLSGTYITLQYGEGILDFVYADFVPAIQKAMKLPLMLEYARDEYLKANPQKEFKEKEKEKAYNQNQLSMLRYLCYRFTASLTNEISYQSLYSAVCPPVFLDEHKMVACLRRYGNYLLMLQKEYRELLEFCYDEEFWPEILGNMHPAERYAMYRCIHGQPVNSRREENFSYCTTPGKSDIKPYGISREEFMKRFQTELEVTDQHTAFAEHYGMEMDDLMYQLRFPMFVQIDYRFGSVAEILELEFTKMLEQDVRFRKCKRCGRYFIMKGNYDTRYCDRVAPGETRTCQDLAAQENYKKKVEDDPAIAIYMKYYKRYSARVKVRQIKPDDFKRWKYQAMTKRNECSDEAITPEEFVAWMEASFPNRTKKEEKKDL